MVRMITRPKDNETQAQGQTQVQTQCQKQTQVTMTKAEYSRHRGISKAAVTKLVRNDSIIVFPDGQIDVVLSDLLLNSSLESIISNECKNGQGRKQGRHPDNDIDNDLDIDISLEGQGQDSANYQANLGYRVARTELTYWKAKIEQLDYEVSIGERLPRDKVEKQAYDLARLIRNNCLGIIDRISGEILATTLIAITGAIKNINLNQFTAEIKDPGIGQAIVNYIEKTPMIEEVLIKEIMDKELRQALENLSQ